MKSIFFHLMPYRDLPDDFEERYESVWVTPPNKELCDPKMVAQYYKWNLDELELADRSASTGSASTSTTRTPTASWRRRT